MVLCINCLYVLFKLSYTSTSTLKILPTKTPVSHLWKTTDTSQYSCTTNDSVNGFNSSTSFSKLNFHLLRKEFVYTKLKYSRSPAFDIVSGGAAALFAAFFGFLVSEKFGIELVDSGDFYYLNMYIVITAYSLKTFKDLVCVSNSFNQFISFYHLRNYYSTLTVWALKLVNRVFTRVYEPLNKLFL